MVHIASTASLGGHVTKQYMPYLSSMQICPGIAAQPPRTGYKSVVMHVTRPAYPAAPEGTNASPEEGQLLTRRGALRHARVHHLRQAPSTGVWLSAHFISALTPAIAPSSAAWPHRLGRSPGRSGHAAGCAKAGPGGRAPAWEATQAQPRSSPDRQPGAARVQARTADAVQAAGAPTHTRHPGLPDPPRAAAAGRPARRRGAARAQGSHAAQANRPRSPRTAPGTSSTAHASAAGS